MQFSFLMPYWVFPHNTITFHKYFWCSWFCECHRFSTVLKLYQRGFCLRRHCNFLSTDSTVRVINQAIKMSSFFDWFLFKKYFQINSYKAITCTNLKVMKMTQEFMRLLRRFWLNDEYMNFFLTEFWTNCLHRGGSRGRVQGVCTPLPWDDLRFSNTTGILQRKENYVVYWYWSRARDQCTLS